MATARERLTQKVAQILAKARREGRPVSYREDEEIAALRAQIRQLDAKSGRKTAGVTASTRARQLRIMNEVRRRTGTAGLATYRQRAAALRQRGLRRR